MKISFNNRRIFQQSFEYFKNVLESNHHSGNGPYSHWCHRWLEENIGCKKALLTTSATAALEMAVMLADIGPGDEVIMPSFTFPSTANAVVLRGGIPVFVEINPFTLSMDEARIEKALTNKCKAIIHVHYAGFIGNIRLIMEIARRHDLILIEDAAHAIMSRHSDGYAGSFGDFAAFSFHETKNISCGEGGALLINRENSFDRAEIIWEKGTDRNRFFQGKINKYQWMDIGSSYMLSELLAALLKVQLEHCYDITAERISLWNRYHELLESGEAKGMFKRPFLGEECRHNGHLYYLLLPTAELRESLRHALNQQEIEATFHYLPLHNSPAGKRFGRSAGQLPLTEDISRRLLRLPLWTGMTDEVEQVVAAIYEWADRRRY